MSMTTGYQQILFTANQNSASVCFRVPSRRESLRSGPRMLVSLRPMQNLSQRSSFRMLFFLSSLRFLALIVLAQVTAQPTFQDVLEKLEQIAVDFARQVEEIYGRRCEPSTFTECGSANYAECTSVSLAAECVPFGSGERLEDTSTSVVRIPKDLQTGRNGNPRNPQTIESVCYSAALDPYFKKIHKENAAFWEEIGAPPPQMYFGSESGAFRIYPGRYTECQDYDPRVRPWYNAASSPKNLLLLLDVSGSMDTDDRISSMKEATKVIVNALTITDRVAVIPFSDKASVIADNDGGPILFEASTVNKEKIIQEIEKLSARGGTNFVDPFSKALDVFERSHDIEVANDCTTAVVFLTDGQMTKPEGLSEEEAFQKISEQLAIMEMMTANPLFVFTYSVGLRRGESVVHEFPRRIACSVDNGVWSSIGESEEIFQSLTGYNKLFALGLGDEENRGFTAWVEPYLFSSGIWGVTVSSPVYDRTKSPPLFLGVVGVDNTLETFNRLLAAEGESQTFLTKIAERSAARCPRLDDLDSCLLESYRRQSRAGDEALCLTTNNTCDFVDIEEAQCSFISDYPTAVLVPADEKERQTSMGMCDNGGNVTTVLVGIFATLGVLLVGAMVVVLLRRKKPVYAGKQALPPPTAPQDRVWET